MYSCGFQAICRSPDPRRLSRKNLDAYDAALRNLKPRSRIHKDSDRDGTYVAVSPTGTITFRYGYQPQLVPRDAHYWTERPYGHVA